MVLAGHTGGPDFPRRGSSRAGEGIPASDDMRQNRLDPGGHTACLTA
jgi:hypothetical protein